MDIAENYRYDLQVIIEQLTGIYSHERRLFLQ